MPLLPADARRALVVFSAGGRAFSAGDVLASLPAPPAAFPREIADGEIELALEAFRYQRDLVSAEECEAWLAQRGLEYADLHASMARRIAGAPADDAEGAQIDALLDARFDGQARELARLAAVACELKLDLAAPPGQWQAACDALLARAIDPAARRRALAEHALALTRMTFTLVEFDSVAAAREARMCAEQDALPLTQLAAEHGFPLREFAARSDELPPAIASALQHAQAGQLCLVAAPGACTGLVRLHARTAPTLDDPQVAARIDQVLRERTLDALVSRHVHWTWPLHLTG